MSDPVIANPDQTRASHKSLSVFAFAEHATQLQNLLFSASQLRKPRAVGRIPNGVPPSSQPLPCAHSAGPQAFRPTRAGNPFHRRNTHYDCVRVARCAAACWVGGLGLGGAYGIVTYLNEPDPVIANLTQLRSDGKLAIRRADTQRGSAIVEAQSCSNSAEPQAFRPTPVDMKINRV